MRVEWADIVSAARETSEALVGKDWVNARIKARVLLADLADEVERLRGELDAAKSRLCYEDGRGCHTRDAVREFCEGAGPDDWEDWVEPDAQPAGPSTPA